ncbi:DUF3240 family protein [Methylomonas rapida]|uniref:DUF3240 family protein n=1 Tax=Methylomonas rapida TaxID=2963939 RepID=A0ABY7GKP3_9GAMM|nr:DUF3240 family protein [Methylomonas rapida]WAR45065.1 DUF3240 family protein [Methylomonas rapida]
MNIFLRRIPANTQHVEISEFVSPALNNGLFRKPSRILNIEILALRDIRVDSIEYHGLVTLDSDWAVKRAVNGLRNRRLNGRYVVVRPYFHRSWTNDPRQHSQINAADFVEKRQGDRRRGKYLEVIKNVSDQFNTEDDFFKSVNHQPVQITFIVPAQIEMAVAECFVGFELEKAAAKAQPDDAIDYRITRFLTELEGPEKKSRRFQIYSTRPVLAELLEKLRSEFAQNNIYYWITPVIEFGVI